MGSSAAPALSRHATLACATLTSVALLLSLLTTSHPQRAAHKLALPASIAPPPLPKLSPESCAALATSWVTRARGVDSRRGEAPALNLTFFLHVPRTAGRTLFFCALKPAFAPSERCLRSYDELRVRDLAKPDCALLSSHDDYRLVDGLPGNATVVTQMRRPRDRVVSAYEFAVEVAARNTFGRARSRLGLPPRPGRTSTTHVWPWSVLVPLLAADMDSRWQARGHRRPSRFGHGAAEAHGGGYVNPFVMSLHDFVRHPTVVDTIHNGATFQLLGLTANDANFRSGDEGADARATEQAAQLRACTTTPGRASDILLEYAHARLEGHVAAVTLTDRLNESVALLAASLRRPLSGRAYRTASDRREQEQRERLEQNPSSAAAVDATAMFEAGMPLAQAYHKCVIRQSDRAKVRRKQAFSLLEYADGAGFAFQREVINAPAMTPLLDAIRGANHMDTALYAHAERLFDKRRQVRWPLPQVDIVNKSLLSDHVRVSTLTGATGSWPVAAT